MTLHYKNDMDKAIERIEAWWHCELVDRPCVQLKVHKKSSGGSVEGGPSEDDSSEGKPAATWRRASGDSDEARANRSGTPAGELSQEELRRYWFDAEYQIDRAVETMENTLYVGEAFPSFVPNLGPDLWATLYGAELTFGKDTSWAEHFVEDWDDYVRTRGSLEPDFNTEYWKTIETMTDLSLERGKGKYITALPDFHPGADLLAALRDVDKLCIDLIEIPDTIKEINDTITDYYLPVYDRLYNKLRAKGLGTTTWLSVYHDGRYYVPSCDFSALISPELFNSIFLPAIHREVECLDRSIYHLDGPGALRHLDKILAIPGLNGLQWVYGAGNGPATKWVEVYQKAQAAGKCIQVLVDEPEEIDVMLKKLKPEGLLFSLSTYVSEKKAAEIIKKAEQAM